jgi:hypothetical protein
MLSCQHSLTSFQAPKLPVREDHHGKVFVANLSVLPIRTAADFDRMFACVWACFYLLKCALMLRWDISAVLTGNVPLALLS